MYLTWVKLLRQMFDSYEFLDFNVVALTSFIKVNTSNNKKQYVFIRNFGCFSYV
jgi:hypothetical protein